MSSKKFPGVGAAFTNNSATSQLLSDASKSLAAKSEKIVWLPREQVKPNPHEKKIYDLDSLDAVESQEILTELDALARDIADRGITNALNVIATGTDEYMVIGGHRRRLANEIAVIKYGYTKGEMLPCCIRQAPDPGREFETTENMILDNLQREKSDYHRMMEIVSFMEATRARKAAGDDIPNVRDRVKVKLGVSDTEITRYEKIYSCLDSSLMDAFRLQKIASTVAYEVAKLDGDCQTFIAKNWDRAGSLSLALMNAYVAEYNRTRAIQDKEPDVEVEHKPAKQKIAAPTPSTFVEGVDMLNEAVSSIKGALSSSASKNMDKKLRAKILKKISKQMSSLMALQNELAMLGLTGEESHGN